MESSERRYQFRGSLSDQPVAEILFKICQYGVPGVLEVVRESVVKRLYLRNGHVVHVSSSELKESLGYYLLSSGFISREDFQTTMRERQRSDQRYGELLVERDLLSPAELRRAIQRQTAEILWDLFSWSQGEVRFSLGEFEPPSAASLYVPVRLAIKEGVRRAKDARGWLARVGERSTKLEPVYQTEDLLEGALEERELQLLRMVDGKRTLLQLCQEGPFDPHLNGRLLYAFHVLKLVRSLERESTTGSIKIRFKTGEQRTVSD